MKLTKQMTLGKKTILWDGGREELKMCRITQKLVNLIELFENAITSFKSSVSTMSLILK